MKRITRLLLTVLPFCFLVHAANASALTGILNIRYWTAPDNTRIVVDTDTEARYSIQEEEGKYVIEIPDSRPSSGLQMEYQLDAPAVSRVLVVPLPGDTTRVEVMLSTKVSPTVFKLGKILDKPHRIVIDVTQPEVEQRETDERIRIGREEEKKIIVLDPGHGGEDPGAVGRLGTKEKDIVLKIARETRDLLVDRGYQVFLTRDGDYYVNLMRRGEIARQYNADLFISIHADAAPVRSARGSSVYCLSTIGASNEAARLLAASQNLSDILGGDPGNGNNGETDPVILNMLQTESLNQSRSFGAVSLDMLGRVNDLKFTKIQGAPFRVLKLPDITSILIETAYLSNPREELLLRSSSFQRDVSWAIAAAVTEYLPTRKAIAFREKDDCYKPGARSLVTTGKETVYTVRRGDCLERIAANHGITVRALMETNNFRSKNRIYAGQKIRIPGFSSPADKHSPAPAVYTVEAGDTLEQVARRYGVSMADLARVNSIQSRDRIYVGQKLHLKEPPAPDAVKEPAVHVVSRGDTLEGISHRYGVSVNELIGLNNIRSRDRIYVGQRLVLAEAPPAEPQASESPASQVHVVNRGDTLEQIARRYGVPMEDLLRFNDIPSRDRIYVGQELDLKDTESDSSREPAVHVVARGDTLEGISRRYDVSMKKLTRLNNISSRNMIYVGQRLVLAEQPPEPSMSRVHVVCRGDTLEKIARCYGITVDDMLHANELQSAHLIRVGQKLRVPIRDADSGPAAGPVNETYIVSRGDTLEGIAKRFDTSVESLMTANDLNSRNRILVGQRLTINR